MLGQTENVVLFVRRLCLVRENASAVANTCRNLVMNVTVSFCFPGDGVLPGSLMDVADFIFLEFVAGLIT